MKMTLNSFIADLEEDRNTMNNKLINYEGRCAQLREDIDRINFAINQAKRNMESDND